MTDEVAAGFMAEFRGNRTMFAITRKGRVFTMDMETLEWHQELPPVPLPPVQEEAPTTFGGPRRVPDSPDPLF